MPARIKDQEGSTCRAGSRSGMAATTIQSTTASRPIRAAVNWLTSVEKVLLIRPSRAAARQFTPAAEDQKRGIAADLCGRPPDALCLSPPGVSLLFGTGELRT